MDTALQDFSARSPRVQLTEVPITMAPEGFHKEFDAAALNVGIGGLSIRSNVVPQVGTRLHCEFTCPGNNDSIRVSGEVVWTQETAADVAEFGVRFTDLAQSDSIQLEQYIAKGQRGTQAEFDFEDENSGVHDIIEMNECTEVKKIRLALQGVDSTVLTQLRTELPGGIEVEQQLPFLQIGTEVQNLDTGSFGVLRDIHLRFEGNVPKLVLRISHDAEIEERNECMDTLRDGDATMTERQSDVPQRVFYDRASEDVVLHAKTVATRLMALLGTAWVGVRAWGGKDATSFSTVLPVIGEWIGNLVQTVRRFATLAIRNLRQKEPIKRQKVRKQSSGASRNLRKGPRLRLRWVLGAVVSALLLWEAYSILGPSDAAPDEAIVETTPAPQAEVAMPVAAIPTPSVPAPHEVQPPVAQPQPISGLSFGAANVANGRKFVLQMSGPIRSIEGLAEGNGFSVVIPDALSHSRAGPIATAHPFVERAMILNRGDRAELTLGFIPGKRPLYRVEAVGSTLEVTIGH